MATGTVGGTVDISTGQDCARACALDIPAQLDAAAGPDGVASILDADRIRRQRISPDGRSSPTPRHS